MDPTDFLITPNNKKQSAVNTLSELTTIQKNEPNQYHILYNKHKQTIYHCRTCPVFEFIFDLGTKINIFVLPDSLTPLQTKKQKQRSQRIVELGASPWRRRPPGWPLLGSISKDQVACGDDPPNVDPVHPHPFTQHTTHLLMTLTPSYNTPPTSL